MGSIRALKPATRWLIFAGISAAALAIVAALKPMPMPQSYHHFADTRALLGVPNAGDVLSSLVFIAVGVLGLYFSLRGTSPLAGNQRWAYGTMFAGLLLTGFGSAYYHLAPDNSRLVLDRLPMTIAMAGLISALITDRFGKIGLRILPLTAAVGLVSVIQWGLSEARGQGDVRWYVLYQGMVMMTVAAVLIMFPSPRPGTREFVIATVANFAAKMFELFDKPIFAAGGVVSGHTLKHLSAGLGFLPLVVLLAGIKKEESRQVTQERKETS